MKREKVLETQFKVERARKLTDTLEHTETLLHIQGQPINFHAEWSISIKVSSPFVHSETVYTLEIEEEIALRKFLKEISRITKKRLRAIKIPK